MNQCRICLEDDDNLIKPCSCSGTQNYVHQECIDKWRDYNRNNEKFYKCSECLSSYELEEFDVSKKNKLFKKFVKFYYKIIKNYPLVLVLLAFLQYIIIGTIIYYIPGTEVLYNYILPFEFYHIILIMILGSFFNTIIDFLLINILLLSILYKKNDLNWTSSNNINISKLYRLNLVFLAINLFSPIIGFVFNISNLKLNSLFFLEYLFYDDIFNHTRVINLEDV